MLKKLFTPAAEEASKRKKASARSILFAGLALTAVGLLSSCIVVEEKYVRRNLPYYNDYSSSSTTVVISSPPVNERCHWKKGWLGGWVQVCEPVGRGDGHGNHWKEEHHRWDYNRHHGDDRPKRNPYERRNDLIDKSEALAAFG